MLQNSFIFLPGIGTTTEQKLWRQGIKDWDAYITADDINGIGAARNEKHTEILQRAKKNLDVYNHSFFNHKFPGSEHWRLYREFQDSTAYLDIETTGLDQQRDEITTISIYDGNTSHTLIQGQDLTGARLQDEISRHSLIVTFNGSRFDIPFMKGSFPGLTIEQPHVDLRFAFKKVGITGGLKSIEKQLGMDRGDLDDVDGKEAIRLWRRYQNGDQQALDRLVKYNQKDVENLEPLIEEAYPRLTQKKFKPHIS